MNSRILRVAAALVGMALAASYAFAQTVTVPTTFSANTTAKASEVNANFEALATAATATNATVTALAATVSALPGAPTAVPSGYSGNGAFASTDTLAGRNVIVLQRKVDTNLDGTAESYVYQVRMAYTDTSGNYVFENATVNTGTDGMTVTIWSKNVDTMTGTDENKFTEGQYTQQPYSTALTLTRTLDNQRHCFTANYYGVMRACIRAEDNTAINNTRVFDESRITVSMANAPFFTANTVDIGPNSLTFPDTNVVGRIDYRSTKQIILIARNVGVVFRHQMEVDNTPYQAVWYRVGGVAYGSLAPTTNNPVGTPFGGSGSLATGNPFFTP
ncbi:MAG: hypothetical protein HY423_06170 [Candidatus Lambdaproteobacteria bacterium]|nr:hypothetical protein [Candidatus Lambdaproteobacteria bacterium]